MPSDTLAFTLAAPRGYRPEGLLAFMAGRAFAGVERVTPTGYARAFAGDGGHAAIVATLGRGGVSAVWHAPPGAAADGADALRARLARMFDLAAPARAIAAHLARDPVLDRLLRPPDRATPVIARIPSAWDPFELAVRAILGQQITVKAATTLAARIIAHHGRPLARPLAAALAPLALTHVFPTRAVLARAELGPLGVIRARGEAIRALALACAPTGRLPAADRPIDEFVSELVRLRGIGAWTAQYVALRGLGHTDAFPSGDLGLVRGYARAANREVSPRELERVAEAWRPYRGYAAMLLWQSHARTTP